MADFRDVRRLALAFYKTWDHALLNIRQTAHAGRRNLPHTLCYVSNFGEEQYGRMDFLRILLVLGAVGVTLALAMRARGGTFRTLCDFGLGGAASGALGLGLAATSTHSIEGAFWFVAAAMMLSGLVLAILGEETHPRLNPAST